MTDEKKNDEKKSDLLDMYGGREKVMEALQKDMFSEMNRNLLLVTGLVSFKLITHELARAATIIIEDPNERIHRSRQIKERLREKVLNEWKTVGPENTLTKFRSVIEKAFPADAVSEDELQEILRAAVKDIDSWASQAFDMTPSVSDLMESLNLSEKASKKPTEPSERVEPDEGGDDG